MQINAQNIALLNTKVDTAFNKRLKTTASVCKNFTMFLKSTTRQNFYPRMLDLPGIRLWHGPKIINSLSEGEHFFLKNEPYEGTVGIDKFDLKDDQYGLLLPSVAQLGQYATEQPDKLVFKLLNDGHKNTGIDGQPYFDTDHVGFNKKGEEIFVSNILRPQDIVLKDGEKAPAEVAPWYLLCTTQVFMPFIFQTREEFVLIARTDPKSDNVFKHKRFEWGVEGRCTAGYGFHQFALRCTAELTASVLNQAYKMMSNQYRVDGTPFATKPDLLLVPTSLESAGRLLLEGDLVPTEVKGGNIIPTSNTWKKKLRMIDTPWLNDEIEA